MGSMRKVQTRLTRGMPRYLVIEHRILEILYKRDREFDELCFEMRESPTTVRQAVSRLMRGGWIHLIPSTRHAVYHYVPGALVGWTREQDKGVR